MNEFRGMRAPANARQFTRIRQTGEEKEEENAHTARCFRLLSIPLLAQLGARCTTTSMSYYSRPILNHLPTKKQNCPHRSFVSRQTVPVFALIDRPSKYSKVVCLLFSQRRPTACLCALIDYSISPGWLAVPREATGPICSQGHRHRWNYT